MTASGPRVVQVIPNGPVMVQGPVRIELPDGSVVASDGFVVAICACRRSQIYPLRDTSYRRRCRAPGVGSAVGVATFDISSSISIPDTGGSGTARRVSGSTVTMVTTPSATTVPSILSIRCARAKLLWPRRCGEVTIRSRSPWWQG
jgi:hypothetical protein